MNCDETATETSADPTESAGAGIFRVTQLKQVGQAFMSLHQPIFDTFLPFPTDLCPVSKLHIRMGLS